jgi:hypothetical protein
MAHSPSQVRMNSDASMGTGRDGAGSNSSLARSRAAGRRWPTWAKVLAAAGLIVLLGVAAVAAVGLLDRSDFTARTLAGPVVRVEVQVARGDIELVLGSSDDVVVQQTERWRFRRPDTTAVIDGATARIRSTCPRAVMLIGTCSVTHRVEVPPGVRVDVRTDSGEVTVQGLDGWVRVVTSDGRVEGTELRSPEVLVDTSGGKVHLGFDAQPSRVDVDSGGGDVVIVAPGGPYEVQVRAEGGEVEVGIEDEDMAEAIIAVASRGGSVSITAP